MKHLVIVFVVLFSTLLSLSSAQDSQLSEEDIDAFQEIYGQHKWFQPNVFKWFVVGSGLAVLLLVFGLGYCCCNYCCVAKRTDRPPQRTSAIFMVLIFVLCVAQIILVGILLKTNSSIYKNSVTLSQDFIYGINNISALSIDASEKMSISTTNETMKKELQDFKTNTQAQQLSINLFVAVFLMIANSVRMYMIGLFLTILLLLAVLVFGTVKRWSGPLRVFLVFGFYIAFFCCILFLFYILSSAFGRISCNAIVTTVNTTDEFFYNYLVNTSSNPNFNVTNFKQVQSCLINGTTTPILLSSYGILDAVQGMVPDIKDDVTDVNNMISSCEFVVGDALLGEEYVSWGNHKFILDSLTAIDTFVNETNEKWIDVNLSQCKSDQVDAKFLEIVSGALALKDILQLIDCYTYQQFYKTVFVEDLCTDLLHYCVRMGILSACLVFVFVGLLVLAFWAGMRLWTEPIIGDGQQTYGQGDSKFVELKEMGHQIN